MPDGEALGGAVLPRPAGAGAGARARVEAHVRDDHVDVTAVGVDRDPAAAAPDAPTGEVARDKWAVEQAGRVERVGDRARAVVARVVPVAVTAAPLVGGLGDLVAGGDHVF